MEELYLGTDQHRKQITVNLPDRITALRGNEASGMMVMGRRPARKIGFQLVAESRVGSMSYA